MTTDADAPLPLPAQTDEPWPLRSLLRRALAFVLVFMALQAGWEAARGSWVERLWVNELTVRSAAAAIDLLTPEVNAVPQGSRIVAPGGGLNVLFGCEGTDVVFMLAAAFAVFPMPVRMRVLGLLTGWIWVFVLNQVRIAALFYSFRADRGLFDLLHTTAAPLVMIASTGLFFHLWLRHAQPPEHDRALA
ncbi:MAG: archaeosortase/exosortase family protein [Pseudomonadota bacterium]|nr:archaeosortase/exosortase family protein [Pseudomonadota bacterium]